MNFDQLVTLCQRTHEEMGARATRSVDAHLVVRNWLFGHYIAEFEQQGADRAEYGARLLGSLADRLKRLNIKGTSVTRLKLYRSFYRIFPIRPTLSDELGTLLPASSEIRPTVSDLLTADGRQLPATLAAELQNHFPLGWSHYVELLTIDSPDERRFYEIEAAANQWSVRGLQRQIASSLYERLALSRDKDEIRRLSAPTVRPIPTQGIALGDCGRRSLALKGRPKIGFRAITHTQKCAAPSGLNLLSSARPRALPWAGIFLPRWGARATGSRTNHPRSGRRRTAMKLTTPAPTARPIPAQGIALGSGHTPIQALKGRPKTACRHIAPARKYLTPSSFIGSAELAERPQPSSLP